MKNSTRRAILIAAIILLCLLVAVGIWSNLRRPAVGPGGTATPSLGPRNPSTSGQSGAGPTAPGPSAPSMGAPTAVATPAPADLAGCARLGTPIEPTSFEVPARGIKQAVIPVGTEPDGAVGDPPDDQRFSVGLWDKGPRIGSTQGNVITTVHTWTGDIALGNVLADAAKGLHPGDIMRFSDGTTTVCYRYRESLKFAVATYDPNSTIWFNPYGRPQVTILICWDYNPSSPHADKWDSRIVFYGDPVGPA